MKKIFVSIIILLFFSDLFPQKSEFELLKNYEFYVEKNIEGGKWSSKFYLTNGCVSVQENYWKNKIRSRTEFEYDRFGNVERKTNTFNSNDGQINDISTFKLEYNDSLLVKKTFDNGMIEKYSDFNELGKPKLIEIIQGSDFKEWPGPYKELIEYDKKGNIIKSTVFSTYYGWDGKTVNEKATTYYKYDDRNNVIEIHRKYEPKQEFPIMILGGPFLYEFEYLRYKYNKSGLWTKKYKTVNGKEHLVAKRKYK